MYITTNENSWMTSDLFLEYIDNILNKYSKNKKRLLIMDHCTSHDTPKVLDKLKQLNIDVIFIPKRKTSVLQPLDCCFYFPFKKYLKLKYSEFIINEIKKDTNLDKSRLRIINDINSVWNGFKDKNNNEKFREKN